jgi:hypothetical protein
VADPQASETGRRMPDSAWHWEQGTKYAVETIKALLAINGGAAVALLAFAGNIAKNGGNAASVASHLANSLLGFGLGTLLGALGFLTAYRSNTAGAEKVSAPLIGGTVPPTR